MVFQNAVHVIDIDAFVEISCCERLTARLELLQADGEQDEQRRFCELGNRPDHDNPAAAERRENEQLGKAHTDEDQACLPVQVQMLRAVGKTVFEALSHAEKQAQAAIDDRVFPERAGFKAR